MDSYKNRFLPFLAVVFAFFRPLWADQKDLLVNTFGGLNTQDSRAALQPYESPDLLNVNLQVGLKSVFKRDGYALFQGLPINTSTTAVHGGYHFQQTSGNDVQLWGNDTELSGSVSDGAFVKLATGTVSATWQCTDNLGFAYCVDSSNDTPVKTDGTVSNTTYQVGIPSGTIVTNTPTRLIVGGIPGNLSTIEFSQSNTFTNFTPGPLQTDPFTEVINAPGSRLTHLAYYFGKVYWWKDQSFGFADCQDQYNCSITIVSNQIGTLDNSSAFWNGTTFESGPNAFSSGASPYTSVGIIGGIFFRGQDNHIYVYDGYALTRLTRRISPTIGNTSRRKINSWIQKTQSDFQNGTIVPTGQLSTTIVPGNVIVSSFIVTEISSTQWTNGTTNGTTIYPSSITLTLNNTGNVTDNSFENASLSTAWTVTSVLSTHGSISSQFSGGDCNMSPQSGSRWMYWQTTGSTPQVTVEAISLDSSTIYGQTAVTWTANNCGWVQNTINMASQYLGKRFKLKFIDSQIADYVITNDSYILGGNITFYFASNTVNGISKLDYFDNIQNGSSTIITGSFTSQVFNTGLTSSTLQLNNFAWTTANTSTPTFSLQTSTASGGPWTTLLTSSGTNAVGNQYVQYVTTITVDPTLSMAAISTATVLARSSGTFYSAVNNAPNFNTWGTMNITDNWVGASSITYYTRAATASFTLTSATPTWVLQPRNSQVAASTGTYMQLRGDFSLTAATEAPSLQSFIFNWFEGTASDKAYIIYFGDYIWISISSGTSSLTNNRILRLDLLNNTWLLDDITANGFLVENNNLYFGDPSQGRVFKYGGVPTDNGNAINAYWQSKDFAGDDPTVQNEFQRADFVFDVAATTVTYTITVDQNSAQAITLPLTLAGTGTNTIIKRGLLLGGGKIGTFYNFRIGDNTSNARWRMLFHNMKYMPLYWKPQAS